MIREIERVIASLGDDQRDVLLEELLAFAKRLPNEAVKRKKLTFDEHIDIESVFDEVQYAASLAQGFHELLLHPNHKMNTAVFIDAMDVADLTKKAAHGAEIMWRDYKKYYRLEF